MQHQISENSKAFVIAVHDVLAFSLNHWWSLLPDQLLKVF
jgi:hypothetical protein